MSMYRFTDNEQMPPYSALQRPPMYPRKPTASAHQAKPAARKSAPRVSPAVRSANAQQQPRDWRGRFASIGRKIKQVKRKIKKVRNTLSPKYHMQRAQRTRRANQRAELKRQGFTVPKKPRKRMPRYKVR